MRLSASAASAAHLHRSVIRRWRRDDSGAAAVEFALVSMPFLLFVLGLLGIGLYFLAATSLEYGAEAAARKVRTGESKKEGMTVGDFKQNVCDAAGPYIVCQKLNVIVQSATNWDGVAPRSCVDANGNVTGGTGSSTELVSKYSGGASEVVLVTLCYQWDLANSFSFLNLGRNADGSGPAIIQAATAFKSEPYE